MGTQLPRWKTSAYAAAATPNLDLAEFRAGVGHVVYLAQLLSPNHLKKSLDVQSGYMICLRWFSFDLLRASWGLIVYDLS